MNTNTAKARLRKALACYFLTPTLKASGNGTIKIGNLYTAIILEDSYTILSADPARKTLAKGKIDNMDSDIGFMFGYGLGSWLHTSLDRSVDTNNIKKLISDGMINEKETAKLIYKWKIEKIVGIENKSRAALRAVFS